MTTTLSAFLQTFPAWRSSTGSQRLRPSSPEVLGCCDEVLDGVPEPHRRTVVAGLARMRRADDMWQLRSALYSAISVAHGEPVARERLERFDRCVAR